MQPTPWSDYVLPRQRTQFYFGYDGGFGLIVILESPYTNETWVCRAAPGSPNAIIATIHEMTRVEVPLYTFSFDPQPNSEHVAIYAHPFALAHLYATEMMSGPEVMGIGASTSRDTFMLQHPIETPCLLTNMLGTTSVTLILGARYDLNVR